MSNYTKVVDGVEVTDTDVSPPRDWTNVYDEIGGDMRWNEDFAEMLKDRGLDGDFKPLYGTCSYTGEALFLVEIGGKDFLIWNALDDSMYRVNGNLTLETIVASLDEEGLNAFELEEL
ncbi:hypothetical protein FPOA_00087 [Fusarium poae]|uniref:Uncharacterized protein n=1 Tax=Fusarium poae TaxID=36050 RepID=A0A1B8B076_FUSPO|nr:hypothetical protein FPOA_00087 [Fusarium poae]